MAGTVAHVLHVDLYEALQMPRSKLAILYNEAQRQRALDIIAMSQAFGGGKDVQRHIDELLKIHGDYTEGFYEQEFAALKKKFMGK